MRIPTSQLTFLVICLLEIELSLCLIDPISMGVGGAIAGAGLLTAGYQKYIKCRIYECCDDKYVPMDVHELQRQLSTRLHGQHIVQTTVVRALRGYKATDNPPKALAISFHGTQGTGKNFVASIIGNIFHKKGRESRYQHWFSGSTFSASRLDIHKDLIKKTIVDSLNECERSMFVFDEVDMMPEGLLDVLSPFMDYGQPCSIEQNSQFVRVVSNKSIFIFLSNKGSLKILEQMTKLRKEGKNRNSMSLSDFEEPISLGAYSEKGGFLNSNAIEASLIDFYVPFLPLEVQHVEACMKDAFASRTNSTPTTLMEVEVMSVVTYFDAPHDLYSKSGCKRIEQKVISTNTFYD